MVEGLLGLDLSASVQMAVKANPCWAGSLAVGTGDGRNVWKRVAASGFLGLLLLCCSRLFGLGRRATF